MSPSLSNLPPMGGFTAFLAALPILTLLVLMIGFRWGAAKAGTVGLIAALLTGSLYFGAGPSALLTALGRGGLLSLKVLYIIWPALLLYQVAQAPGAIRNLGWAVASMTRNHILQLLILAFAFTTFLQGVAGFGVPVAVVTPLLIGMGYPPIQAAAASLVGHAWSVSMGDMASSFQALRAVTDLPAHSLGIWIATLLGGAGILTAFSVSHVHAGFSAVWRWPGPPLILGVATIGTQWVLAYFDLWIIATFGGGMAGLAVGLLLSRIPRYQGPSRAPSLGPKLEEERVRAVPLPPEEERMSFSLAFAPYFALVGVVLLATVVPPIHHALEGVQLELSLPGTQTVYGWKTPDSTWSLSLFGHPGAFLLYAAAIGYLVFRLRGAWPRDAGLWGHTGREGWPASIGIVTMTCMATIMTASGMTMVLAKTLFRVAGQQYPFLSPFVGLLGCIITGSNTNSNILFGALQTDIARLLDTYPVLLGAVQSAGGALGSMVAPAKVLLACATAGLAGQEGRVIGRTLGYCLLMTALVGLVAWWVS